ncbi:MAG TPA: DNA recombination protein RmuC [Cyclobacteriaceae bacterium]
MEIVWFILGIVLGGVVSWFLATYRFKSNLSSNETAVKVYDERIKDMIALLENARDEVKRERDKVITLSNRLSGNEADYRNLKERFEQQKEEVAKLQERFSIEFKNLAQDILEEKSRKFTIQNKENLEGILKPLSERIIEFEKTVQQNSKESIEWNSALREQIKSLKELNIQVTKEAENLTKALKGDNRAMGAWGEIILESILENSGLVKDREYIVQSVFVHDDGRRYQPDVVINLPDDKHLVIDSKISLVSYERFVNAETKEDTKIAIKSHLTSIRSHIRDLSSKNYQTLYGVKSLDFVLMFIPIESAFSLAVQNDSYLFNEAYDRNIVLVSPTTLIATLRTIANIWKNEYQNRNALEIARQGGELYDKFVNFTEDLLTLGKHLDQTQKHYSSAMKKLVEGQGNLISKATKIKELGAKTRKSIDQRLIERSED